ncbi:MAG TPA: integrase arm-type DNA-binding domain-containing protein [Rhodocyclaceae bacterium]|nr:integrase arm-type DNA-binding domain-containing protein [Rhodocyclaceae bacterium]
MALTDTAVRSAKPGAKPLKLADEKGLYLFVSTSGGKLWRFDYRFAGRRKTVSFGAYPEVSLKQARERRDLARQGLADGIDPSEQRRASKMAGEERAANSFEVVAREWYAKMAPTWVPSHGEKIIRRLERDIFPWIGGQPVSEVPAQLLLTTVRKIEDRGRLETAHRALQNCSQVFRYAIATGRAERDPASDLRGALPPVREKHFAAITEPKEVGALLRAIDGFTGTFIVKAALQLAPLVFARPGELRKARWGDIDLDKAEWRYLVTKTNSEHLVPLSTQAVAILRDLHPLTGRNAWVFPGMRDHQKPMSEAAINAALRRMGYDTKDEMTGHGFRAMARTILHEELGFEPAVIEHQLAHRVPDALGAAYNRTKFIKERRAMMQRWADYLDQVKAGADVVMMPTKGAA